MKKLITLCIVAVFATSCKKKAYTCVCTSTDTSNGRTETTVSTYKASSTKKDADAWCKAIPLSMIGSNGVSVSLSNNMACVLN